MTEEALQRKLKRQQQDRRLVAVFIGILGVAILLALAGFYAFMLLPTRMGYQTYAIVNDTMDPEIELGSAVIVEETDPGELKVGDVFAYRLEDGESVSVRRVTRNDLDYGLITGEYDNEETLVVVDGEEGNEVSYERYIGKVIKHYPALGILVDIVERSRIGQAYLLVFGLCGVLALILSVRMWRR